MGSLPPAGIVGSPSKLAVFLVGRLIGRKIDRRPGARGAVLSSQFAGGAAGSHDVLAWSILILFFDRAEAITNISELLFFLRCAFRGDWLSFFEHMPRHTQHNAGLKRQASGTCWKGGPSCWYRFPSRLKPFPFRRRRSKLHTRSSGFFRC